MIMNRYEIRYKARISKAEKMAHVVAKTKVEAKRALAIREASPIIQSVFQIGKIEVNISIPRIEQIKFI